MKRKAFKYRIYPSKSQAKQLNAAINACRFIWNDFLGQRKELYESEKKSISKFDQINRLPELKKKFPFLKSAHSQSLQHIGTTLDLAFRAFSQRLKRGETPGYPRFKGSSRLSSVNFPQYGNGCRMVNGKLAVSKIGDIKTIYHRELVGTPKTARIKRTATGKWFVTIVCECEPEMLPIKDNLIGIDLGISKFATLSNGEIIENPRFLKAEEENLRRAQSKADKLAKGSSERKKARKVVNRIYERLNWRRENFTHQESRKIVNKYQNIFLERLDISSMVEDGRFKLGKYILDVSWGQFTSMVKYKAEEAGRNIVFVNPFNTSRMCSRCGILIEKELSQRTHSCKCGLEIDRDLNAALNILRLGTQSLKPSL